MHIVINSGANIRIYIDIIDKMPDFFQLVIDKPCIDRMCRELLQLSIHLVRHRLQPLVVRVLAHVGVVGQMQEPGVVSGTVPVLGLGSSLLSLLCLLEY